MAVRTKCLRKLLQQGPGPCQPAFTELVRVGLAQAGSSHFPEFFDNSPRLIPINS